MNPLELIIVAGFIQVRVCSSRRTSWKGLFRVTILVLPSIYPVRVLSSPRQQDDVVLWTPEIQSEYTVYFTPYRYQLIWPINKLSFFCTSMA